MTRLSPLAWNVQDWKPLGPERRKKSLERPKLDWTERFLGKITSAQIVLLDSIRAPQLPPVLTCMSGPLADRNAACALGAGEAERQDWGAGVMD